MGSPAAFIRAVSAAALPLQAGELVTARQLQGRR